MSYERQHPTIVVLILMVRQSTIVLRWRSLRMRRTTSRLHFMLMETPDHCQPCLRYLLNWAASSVCWNSSSGRYLLQVTNQVHRLLVMICSSRPQEVDQYLVGFLLLRVIRRFARTPPTVYFSMWRLLVSKSQIRAPGYSRWLLQSRD